MKFGFNASRIQVFAILQLMNILFSLDSVLIKLASIIWEKDGLLSIKVIGLLVVAVAVLGIYAICWQKILSRIELTVAYMCKGMTIFWGMLWSFLLFKESITVLNIVGCFVIFLGTYMVMTDEK